MMSHKNGWWLVIGCSLNAIHSRTTNCERSLICNSQDLQYPKLPLYKEILRILTKLRKNERNAKGKLAFLLHSRDGVSSAKPKIQKKRVFIILSSYVLDFFLRKYMPDPTARSCSCPWKWHVLYRVQLSLLSYRMRCCS